MNDGAVKSEGKSIEELVPFMDRDPQTTVAAAKMPSPRLMKTHMPYGCLPAAIEAGNAKVTSGLFSSCRRTRLLTLIALVDAQFGQTSTVASSINSTADGPLFITISVRLKFVYNTMSEGQRIARVPLRELKLISS